jgi:hypothetical protein
LDNDTTELIFEVAYYSSEERKRVSQNAIERVLHQVEGLKLQTRGPGDSQDERIFTYFNPDTQVSCRFVVFEPSSQDDPSRMGLSFEMDLPRATSFALEALPLVVQVARELRFHASVISPESGDPPISPTVESLLLRWQEANLEEIEYQEEVGSPPFRFKAVDLEALWEYQLLRRELNRRGGAGRAQMAEACMWGNPRTLQVVRCSDWTKLSAIAFPEVDWVRLLYPPAPLKHGRMYAMDDVRKAVRFREQSQPIFHLLYEGSSRSHDVVAQMAEITPVDSAGFKPLSYQEVVDESPLFGDLSN